MSNYMSPTEAFERYELKRDHARNTSELGRELEQNGIVSIEMPLSGVDFERLSNGFAVCLEECPELLQVTASKVDDRYGSEAGYTRKEKRIDRRTGLQVGDPKNYFHFSEAVVPEWRETFKTGPRILREFLEDGFEIHNALLGVAKEHVSSLEGSHPNMSGLYFPNGDSFSFLRLLRYDGYDRDESLGMVAKPHYDIAGVTIQAYADAPGFWKSSGPPDEHKQFFNTQENEAYMFLGKGHEKVYGKVDSLKPLWHGVDRIIPAGVTFVPERTAVILFLDAPEVDYHMNSRDTLPHLGGRALANA